MSTAEQLDFSHYRATDGPTSRAAAQALDLNKRCEELLRAIYRMRVSKPTFTDGDLADFTGEDRGICARRRLDLQERGYVEAVLLNGEHEQRIGRRRRPEYVFMLTEFGYLRGAEVSA